MVKKTNRDLSLEDIKKEIARIQELIKRHREGDVSALGSYSYPAALKRIQYLRCRQRSYPKSNKE